MKSNKGFILTNALGVTLAILLLAATVVTKRVDAQSPDLSGWSNVVPPDEPFGSEPTYIAITFAEGLNYVRAPQSRLQLLALSRVTSQDWRWKKIEAADLDKLKNGRVPGSESEDIKALRSENIKLRRKVGDAVEVLIRN